MQAVHNTKCYLSLDKHIYVPSSINHKVAQGRIQRLKKGGAHIEWGWCGHAARAARGIFLCERIRIAF